MTALDERPAAGAATTDDIAAYLPAARAYAREHPGNGTGAVRAGLDAVLDNRERHPPTTVQSGIAELQLVHAAAAKDALIADGWTCLGFCSCYVMAPPSTGDRPAVDGAP